MINARIDGATRTLGKSQGYLGLSVRDSILGGTATMTSSWEPTPAELALLNAGAKVHLTVLGSSHPPVKVTVGERPS